MFSMFSLGLHVLPQGLYFAPPFICLIFSPAHLDNEQMESNAKWKY